MCKYNVNVIYDTDDIDDIFVKVFLREFSNRISSFYKLDDLC